MIANHRVVPRRLESSKTTYWTDELIVLTPSLLLGFYNSVVFGLMKEIKLRNISPLNKCFTANTALSVIFVGQVDQDKTWVRTEC